MNTLYIYSNEYGVFPEQDTDDPYVACAIASPFEIPELQVPYNDVDAIFRLLKAHSAHPMLKYVYPVSGLGKAIEKGYSNINVIRNLSRRLTKDESVLLTKDQILRFDIPSWCIDSAIFHILVGDKLSSPIYWIQIILDQAVSGEDERELFACVTRNTVFGFKEFVLESPHVLQYYSSMSFSNLLFSWSDCVDDRNHAGGMKAAKALAKCCWGCIRKRKGNEREFTDLLRKHEYFPHIMDCTHIIMTIPESNELAIIE